MFSNHMIWEVTFTRKYEINKQNIVYRNSDVFVIINHLTHTHTHTHQL